MQIDLGRMDNFKAPLFGAVGCPNCDMVLESMAYLEIHINSSATMCHLCGTQCCSGVNLKNHMNIECDLAIRNRNYDLIAQESAMLGRGIINSKELYNLPIEADLEELKEKIGMQDHRKNNIKRLGNGLIACGFCYDAFDSKRDLRLHRNSKHPEYEEFRPVEMDPQDVNSADGQITFACPICEWNFVLFNSCALHIKVEHLGWKQRKILKCNNCEKCFTQHSLLVTHQVADHQGIRTLCPICDKPVRKIRTHFQMVHSSSKNFPCFNCGKKFQRKFEMYRHNSRVHLGIRDHPCDMCGKRFGDKKDMVRHRNAVHFSVN